MTNGFVVIGWTLRALLIPFAALISGVAVADDASSRWSLGFDVGQVRGQGNTINYNSAAATGDLSTMSYDMAATVGGSNRFGWRIFTGYRFTNYLAVHVGYTDLGEAEAKLIENPMAYARMPSFERVGIESVQGVDLALQVKVPVSDRVSVDVHGGKYYWRSQTRIAGLWSEGIREDDFRASRKGLDNFFGAGVEVGVAHDLSATLSWTRYQVGREPVSLWTVGALYRFGFY